MERVWVMTADQHIRQGSKIY